MNGIKIFTNPAFGQIRTSRTNEQPMFCLADVCNTLGLTNARDVKKRLNQKGVCTIDTLTPGGTQAVTYIDEPNLYRCIFQSRKAEAEAFQDWITSEVLPSIRKSGGYISVKEDETPEQIMAKALIIANQAIERQKAQIIAQSTVIEENKPRVLFAQAVETSNRSILIGELAKILNQNGINIGQNRLFALLRQNGFLGQRGDYYNMPTQKSMEMGLFEIKKITITKPDGTTLVSSTTKVTGRGQIYFVNKFLKQKNLNHKPIT